MTQSAANGSHHVYARAGNWPLHVDRRLQEAGTPVCSHAATPPDVLMERAPLRGLNLSTGISAWGLALAEGAQHLQDHVPQCASVAVSANDHCVTVFDFQCWTPLPSSTRRTSEEAVPGLLPRSYRHSEGDRWGCFSMKGVIVY